MTPTMERFYPKEKRAFQPLYIFDVGGDEKIRTSDPGFAQMLP